VRKEGCCNQSNKSEDDLRSEFHFSINIRQSKCPLFHGEIFLLFLSCSNFSFRIGEKKLYKKYLFNVKWGENAFETAFFPLKTKNVKLVYPLKLHFFTIIKSWNENLTPLCKKCNNVVKHLTIFLEFHFLSLKILIWIKVFDFPWSSVSMFFQ